MDIFDEHIWLIRSFKQTTHEFIIWSHTHTHTHYYVESERRMDTLIDVVKLGTFLIRLDYN